MPTVTTRSPGVEPGDLAAHRQDGARSLVADEVWPGADFAVAVQGIAALDTDRLYLYQYAIRRGAPESGTSL